MQMLSAGGFSCDGDYPGFEDYSALRDGWRSLGSYRGRAVKMLDAMLVVGPPPDTVPTRFILSSRNHDEQAKSFEKFCHVVQGLPLLGRGGRR